MSYFFGDYIRNKYHKVFDDSTLTIQNVITKGFELATIAHLYYQQTVRPQNKTG